MFGRDKTRVEDVFETEERLHNELEAARRQLAETTAKIAELDSEYKASATAALDTGDDALALALRGQIDKLGVRKDGLDLRLTELTPKLAEASRVAQLERVAQAEKARRERLAALVAGGNRRVAEVQENFEPLMRALSGLDDVRERLGALEFNPVGGHPEGMAEAGKLQEAVSQRSLRGQLIAAGWRERTAVRATYLEVIGLIAPPK